LTPATPPPEHHHSARQHARHAAEQDAGSAEVAGQKVAADQHRHAPGDLAHRLEQRQAAVDLDRLVGQRGDAGAAHGLGEFAVGGEVKVGEQHLARPQQAVLLRQWFLDLHHQVALGKQGLVVVDQLGAGLLVIGIRIAGVLAGAALHQHRVALLHQLIGDRWQQADPVFLFFDLLGDGYLHRVAGCVVNQRVT